MEYTEMDAKLLPTGRVLTGCGSNGGTSKAKEPENGEEAASSEEGYNDAAPDLASPVTNSPNTRPPITAPITPIMSPTRPVAPALYYPCREPAGNEADDQPGDDAARKKGDFCDLGHGRPPSPLDDLDINGFPSHSPLLRVGEIRNQILQVSYAFNASGRVTMR